MAVPDSWRIWLAHLFPQGCTVKLFLLLRIASSLTPRSGRRQQRWRRHSSVPTSPSITGPSSLEAGEEEFC
ncbi:hypothetical protein ZWY2020_037788 [Hordeum vulgare]|nr:hypothetical protein ZWY2020_037788 [Hordeum vulgare]